MKRESIEFNAKITQVTPVNDEFTMCRCYIFALGKNRNMSHIGKEASDNAIPTLFNIPVVGHMYEDSEGVMHMGGHDMTIDVDNNGNINLKSLCVPYGVVPSQDNLHYEEVEEPNGEVKTYLVGDIILWTGRYPELKDAVYSDNTYFGQSMEINVEDYAALPEDESYTDILSFGYSALCLLGKSDDSNYHVEPCFPMSRIEPVNYSLDDRFINAMDEMKKELSVCFEAVHKEEPCVENEFEVDVIVESDAGDVVVAAEDGSIFAEEIVEKEPEDIGIPASMTEVHDCEKIFSSTYEEKRAALVNAVTAMSSYLYDQETGDCIEATRYYVFDFDDEYVFVEIYNWKYTEAGYEEKISYGKMSYTVDDESGVTSVEITSLKKLVHEWLTEEEREALLAITNKYEALLEEHNELLSYKERREEEDKHKACDEIVEEFSDLAGNEEYDEIVKNKYSFCSADELRNACYIVKGKCSHKTSIKKQFNDPVITISRATENGVPKSDRDVLYERLMKEYKNK